MNAELTVCFVQPLQGRRRGTDHSVISSLSIHSLAETNGSENSETESYCLSDAGLTAVAAGFTKLENLSLVWCSNVTHVGLRSIAERCMSLKSLDLQVNIRSFRTLVSSHVQSVDLFQAVLGSNDMMCVMGQRS